MAKAGGTLFSYTDQNGVDVVVDRLEDVPQAYRSKMKVMSLEEAAAEVKAPTKAEVAQAVAEKAADSKVEPMSVAAGAIFGVLVGFVPGKLSRRTRIVSMVMGTL